MTAVDYLIEQLQAPCKGIPSHIIEQAKEMEKQQMQDFGARCCLLTKQKNEWTLEELYNDLYRSKGSGDASSQTEISEHRFTEKDIRFAYMQGYNRGVDGNPNHMENYIEHLKKKQ